MSVPNMLRLKKTAETLYIKHGLSNAIISQLETNKQKTRESVQREVSTLKEVLNNNTDRLEKSVKGQFAKQAKKAIETETKKVDSF